MEVVLKDVSFFDHEARADPFHVSLGRATSRGELRNHLDKACLRLQPGSVTILMGSPLETTYLLEIIGLRQHNGFIVGSIYHDNSLRKNGSCYRDIAYVKDFDSNFFGHLTVEAFLEWAAQLRLSLSDVECCARAREAAKLLNLEGHVRITELHRGQRILLAVAAEMVENPTLICIESPLDGMDESHVNAVVRALSKIAHRQNTSTTVVLTALAPSARSLRHADHVALLFNCKLLYSSGEMFDHKNPHLGVLSHSNNSISSTTSTLTSTSASHPSGHKRGLAPLAPGEGSNSAGGSAMEFRRVVAECRAVLSTLSRDVCRSGYGTPHFASQFRSSDHRLLAPSSSSSSSEDKQQQALIASKRVQAMEKRLAQHLSRIAELTEGFKDPAAQDEAALLLSPLSSPTRFAHPPRPLQGGPSRQRRLHPSRIVRTSQPFHRETSLLVARSWHCTKNNSMMGWMSAARFVVSGLLLGAMSFSAGDDAGEEASATPDDDFYNEDSFAVASTLFAVLLVNVLGLGLSVPFTSSHLRMLKSEIGSGIYSPVSAWCALLVHDVPWQAAGALCLALLVRLLLGLEDNVGAYYAAVCLCALCAASLAAAVAGVAQNGYRSAQLYLTCACVVCLFAGYLRAIPDMPVLFQWLTDFSFGRWAFELLMLSVFQDTTTGDAYLDGYGFKNQAMSACVLWLLLWIVSLQVVVMVGLFPFPYKSVYSRLEQLTTKTPAQMTSSSTHNALHLLDNSCIVTNEGSYMDVTQDRASSSAASLSYSPGDTPSRPLQVVPLPEIKKTSLWFVDVGFSLSAEDAEDRTSFLSSGRSRAVHMQEEGDAKVLQGVTGDVMPGEMCCIIDGSDDGADEALLQILSGRATVCGKVTGDVRVSDKTLLQGDFVHNSALVLRGDGRTHALLTVRETLEHSAMLRRTDQRSCPLVIHLFLRWRQVSLLRKLRAQGRRQNAADDFIEFNDEEVVATTVQVQEKVSEALRVFDLEDVAEVCIGSSRGGGRRISPSQLRLLTIATEALNRPGLLYLQDPFFGLDWYHAGRVCRVLRAAAAGGRAIICTFPRPTDILFSQFHKTLLLNRGLLLYQGLTAEATNHFKNIGFEPKEDQSDLSFLTDICQERAQMGSVSASSARKSSLLTTEDLVNIRISMSSNADNFSSLSPTASLDALGACAMDSSPASIYTPMMGPVIRRSDAAVGPAARVIAWRRTLTAYRNRGMVGYYYACSLLFGLVLGGMWFSLEDGDIHGRVLVSAVGYLYMTASLAGLLNGTHRRQEDYLRERESGASTGTAYWLGDGVPVIAHTAPHVVLFAAPLYLLAGLRPGFAPLGLFCLLLFFAMYCNIGLMYLVTGLTRDALVSRVVFLGALVPLQLLFSGSIVYLESMYAWLSVLSYLNPMQYFLAGVFTNEFHDHAAAKDSDDLTYGDVKSKYGFHGDISGSLVSLLLLGMCYRVLWLFSLKYREVYEKRHVLAKAMATAHSRVSSFVSSRINSVTASRRASRGNRAKKSQAADLAGGGYFNADALDDRDGDSGDEGDADEDDYDSDQLSSKHSISEFVLNSYNDDDSDGIDGIALSRTFSKTSAGGALPAPYFRREAKSQAQVQAATPSPSRQGGHNRIIIVPKSGGRSPGGGGAPTPQSSAGPSY